MMVMRAILIVAALATAAAGATNLARNPSFESDADRDGTPDDWAAAGDARLVKQALALDKGRDGTRCARLDCTAFQHANAACHAMVCQMGLPVTRGKAYRVRFWARAKAIQGDIVSIALSDTGEWANCGLSDSFAPGPEWEAFDFLFRATRTVGEKSRFQIWFASTGTLWLDGVVFEEAGPDAVRPGHVIRDLGQKNLVPNASFELGDDGWGSEAWDRQTHWGGQMNRLWANFGGSFRGGSALRIHVSAASQPVSFFDYFDLHRDAIWAPLAANRGYIEVEPGRPYTLSVYAKARAADTPVRLAVREFQGRRTDKLARVGTAWQRYSFTFTPRARWCYVLAGPDLRKTQDSPNPAREATVWLDAFQLEKGPEPTEFAPRDPVEFAVWVAPPTPGARLRDRPQQAPDCVSAWGEELWAFVQASSAEQLGARGARVELRVTDEAGREVWAQALDLQARPEGTSPVGRSLGIGLRGYFRLRARIHIGDRRVEQSTRFAVIPSVEAADSRFGVNHAYPWPHLLDLSRKAGLVWARDWSLKWMHVEPEKGRFTFTETDYQIDRPREHGLQVLAMLPFPSAPWSSTAPAELRAKRDYVSRRSVIAYAPRDAAEFENYVGRTVAHYKGRVRWWQVFNEPVFTTYSLPRKFGYTGADYAKWTQAFVRAARRADPECKILAGIGYLRAGQIVDDWERFFAAGGMKGIDAVDIHHYPRKRPPEFVEELLAALDAQMERHGARKPIWLTEYGYYADDDPWAIPIPHSQFNSPLRSEALQAAYAVRWATLCLANGVEKIFYHAGTCDGVNQDSLQGIFYEHAGQPHAIYAAQAVMSHLFTPTCRFVRKLSLGDGVRAYLFRDGARHVAVIWAPSGARPKPIQLTNAKLELWDLMGRPQQGRAFTPGGSPVYVLATGLSDAAFVAAVTLE